MSYEGGLGDPPDQPTSSATRRPRRSLVGRIAAVLDYAEDELPQNSSTLNNSTLAPPSQRRRRSTTPTSPTTTRADTFEAAKTWLRDNLVPLPLSRIPKSEVGARYALYVQESGLGGVAVTTLGKYLKEVYPNVETGRFGGTGTYVGLRWADQPPPPDSQQQQGKDWGEILSTLKSTVPTRRRVPKEWSSLKRTLTKAITEVTMTNTEESWGKLFLFPYAVLHVPEKADKVRNNTTQGKIGLSPGTKTRSLLYLAHAIHAPSSQNHIKKSKPLQERWRPSCLTVTYVVRSVWPALQTQLPPTTSLPWRHSSRSILHTQGQHIILNFR